MGFLKKEIMYPVKDQGHNQFFFKNASVTQFTSIETRVWWFHSAITKPVFKSNLGSASTLVA